MAIEGQPIQIGDTIRGELWNEPFRIDDIGIMGDFLKVGVTPTGSTKSEERLLHISKNIDVLMDENRWVKAILPTLEDLRLKKPAYSLQEGMIVKARERLWRVDSLYNKTETATLFSISGTPSRHEIYLLEFQYGLLSKDWSILEI